MPESRSPKRENRQTVSRTLEATTKAMSVVRQSMGIVRQARDRAEKRIDGLVKELTSVKQRASSTAAREQELRRTLERLRSEHSQNVGEMTKIKKENGRMRMQASELSAKLDLITEKLNKTKLDAEKDQKTIEETMSQENRRTKLDLRYATQSVDDMETQLAAQREFREALQFDTETSRTTIRELKQLLAELLESGQSTMREIDEALGEESGNAEE